MQENFLHVVFHKDLNQQFCTVHFLSAGIHYVQIIQQTHLQLSHYLTYHQSL